MRRFSMARVRSCCCARGGACLDRHWFDGLFSRNGPNDGTFGLKNGIGAIEVRGKRDSTGCCGVNLACASGFVWGRRCFVPVAKAWCFAFFAPLRKFWFRWKGGVFGRCGVPGWHAGDRTPRKALRAAV